MNGQLRLIGASVLDMLRTVRIVREELDPETADRVVKRLTAEDERLTAAERPPWIEKPTKAGVSAP